MQIKIGIESFKRHPSHYSLILKRLNQIILVWTVHQSLTFDLKLNVHEDNVFQEVCEFLVWIDKWIWTVVLRYKVK